MDAADMLRCMRTQNKQILENQRFSTGSGPFRTTPWLEDIVMAHDLALGITLSSNTSDVTTPPGSSFKLHRGLQCRCTLGLHEGHYSPCRRCGGHSILVLLLGCRTNKGPTLRVSLPKTLVIPRELVIVETCCISVQDPLLTVGSCIHLCLQIHDIKALAP
ncbi:uncharacterized [Tachysurus ichikawai]